jgi:hypothetical protein
MFRLRLNTAVLLAAILLSRATSPAAESLSKEQIAKAVCADSVSVPTPGELFAALEKTGKPTWPDLLGKPVPSSSTSRAQMAMMLGVRIADGFIAVQAEDGQQVKNIGKDIMVLAKALSVSAGVISRGQSISDFADRNEWNTLKEEIEATQNEVKLAMAERKDDDLVTLVTLGAWIRGSGVISSWIDSHYTPEAAKLIRQPGIAAFLQTKLRALPDKYHNDDLVKEASKRLDEITKVVSFPPGEVPPPEKITALKAITADLVNTITTVK